MSKKSRRLLTEAIRGILVESGEFGNNVVEHFNGVTVEGVVRACASIINERIRIEAAENKKGSKEVDL